MYQQAAPVGVQEVYSVPPGFDGPAPYVLPPPHGRMPAQAFIGQQYPPAGPYHAINQPMPHYPVSLIFLFELFHNSGNVKIN